MLTYSVVCRFRVCGEDSSRVNVCNICVDVVAFPYIIDAVIRELDSCYETGIFDLTILGVCLIEEHRRLVPELTSDSKEVF